MVGLTLLFQIQDQNTGASRPPGRQNFGARFPPGGPNFGARLPPGGQNLGARCLPERKILENFGARRLPRG